MVLIEHQIKKDKEQYSTNIKEHNGLLEYLFADKGYSGKKFRDKVKRQTGVSFLPLPKPLEPQP